MTRSLFALLAGFSLVTLACGGDDAATATTATTATTAATATTATVAEPAATTTPPIAATTSPPPATSTEPVGATAPAPTAEPTSAPEPTAPPAADGADCLVGDWLIDETEMNGFYDAIEATLASPVDFVVAGGTRLTLTGDTYEYTPGFTLTVDMGGITGTGLASGSVSGTYTVDDGTIRTTLGGSDLALTIEVAGQTLDGSALGNSLLDSAPINDAPFTCGPGGPVIMFQTGDGTPRHPVVLAPA